jgi:hypothetical protein
MLLFDLAFRRKGIIITPYMYRIYDNHTLDILCSKVDTVKRPGQKSKLITFHLPELEQIIDKFVWVYTKQKLSESLFNGFETTYTFKRAFPMYKNENLINSFKIFNKKFNPNWKLSIPVPNESGFYVTNIICQ